MHICKIRESNRNSFIRWFTHTSANIRNLFVAAYSDFLWQRGCTSAFIHEVPSYSLMANAIFSDMLEWKIDSFFLSPDSEEVSFSMLPHIYFRPQPGKSISKFEESANIQDSFCNY